MRKIFSKIDKVLLLMVIILVIFGTLMIFSASSVKALVASNNSYKFLIKQLIFIIGGTIAFIAIIKTPSKIYGPVSILGLGVVFFLLFSLLLYGSFTNSSKSWFYILGFGVQPSEYAKLILILFMGYFYGKNISKITKDTLFITAVPLVVGAILVGFIFLQPDFGTGVILGIITFFMFLALPTESGVKSRIVGILASIVFLIVGVVLFSGGSIFSSRQLSRFDFKNPCDRYTESSGTGYQVCNGYIAISSGGLFGKGIGQSTQKFLYLPEAHTDFIFCIVLEEMGLIVGLAVLVIYGVIIARIYRIAKHSYKLNNSLICYGVATYISAHIVINLIGVLGIAPLTGVPLPFLSYGGSYFLTLVVAIAIVERIEYENTKYYEKNLILRGKK